MKSTKEIQSLRTKVDKMKENTDVLISKNLNLAGQIKANEWVIESQQKLITAYEDQIKFLTGLEEPAPLDQDEINERLRK